MKKFFSKILNGGLNTDDSVISVQPEYPAADYIDSENTRLSALDGFHNTRITIKGNTLKTNELLPTGLNMCIGAFEDLTYNTIIVFNWNEEGEHGIYQYFGDSDTWSELIIGDALDFDRDWKIHTCELVNREMLYFLDGRENLDTNFINGNPPRKLNIIKASELNKKKKFNIYFDEEQLLDPEIFIVLVVINILEDGVPIDGAFFYPSYTTFEEFITEVTVGFSAVSQFDFENLGDYVQATATTTNNYTLSVNGVVYYPLGVVDELKVLFVAQNFYPDLIEDFIDRVKYAPLCEPKCVYKTDIDFKQNFVQKKYFQFVTQYIYDDTEYSRVSPVSKLAFTQKPCGTEFVSTAYNYIEVDFTEDRLNDNSVLAVLSKVNLYVREGYLGAWKLVKTLERWQFGIGENKFKFYNDGNYFVQALPLVQFENSFPLISQGQGFARNRGYLGGNLEGYSNVNVKGDVLLTYNEDECEEPLPGTLSGRVYIRNPNDAGGFDAGKTHQPIHDYGDGTCFGGMTGSLFAETVVSNYDQILPLEGVLIYAAETEFSTISRQVNPNDLPTIGGTDGVYDSSSVSLRNDIRDQMELGNVYSEYSMDMPPGKYVIRVASHLCNEDGQDFYKYPGEQYQQSSTYVKSLAPTPPGIGDPIVTEYIVEIISGVTTTLDIEVWDLVSIAPLKESHVIAGYLIDGEASSEQEDLLAGARVEGHTVQAFVSAGGGDETVNSSSDHNGFFYLVKEQLIGFDPDFTFAVSGCDGKTFMDTGATFYTASTNLILNSLSDASLSSVTELEDVNNELRSVILYNHSEEFSNNCRTNIEGFVLNENDDPIAGVKVWCSMTNRVGITDGIGKYSILVYAEGTEDERSAQLFVNHSGCCTEYLSPDFINVLVSPFTLDANYSINFPYPVGNPFKLKIDGKDVNLFWKHRNNILMGIIYMDIPGRRNKVAQFKEVFIPLETDTNGNIGAPVLQYAISHQPPIWAKKYQIVRQLNPFYNRYLRFIVGEIQYVKLYDLSGEFPVAVPTTFEAGDAVEISLSLIPIVNFAQQNTGSIIGYLPEVGDRVSILKDEAGVDYTDYRDYEITFIGEGSFTSPIQIVIKNTTELNELFPGTFVELYTPKKRVEDDFYFEFGECHDIIDPFTDDRRHGAGEDGADQVIGISPATGFLYGGDTFVRTRKMTLIEGTEVTPYSYKVEDEYIYDNDLNSRQQSIGHPNIFDPTWKQTYHIARTRWSNLFNSDGNKLFNGLSTFDESSFADAEKNFGSITKIVQVGEKAELIIIQKNKWQPAFVEKAALYEYNRDTGGSITASDSPLNFGIPFEANLGCQHPESIVQEGNEMWAFDFFKSTFTWYASTGLIPISTSEKIKKKILEYYAVMIKLNLAHSHIIGAIDRKNGEVVWAFEEMASGLIPTQGTGSGSDFGGTLETTLEDAIAVEVTIPGQTPVTPLPEPFNPVTLSWSFKRKKWETRYTYFPEYLIPLGENSFYTFKSGELYLHDSNILACNFYGEQKFPMIKFPVNMIPRYSKDWYAIVIYSNRKWSVSNIEIPADGTYKIGMKSRITSNNFTGAEGNFYAPFFNNMLDGRFTTEIEALARGEELKGKVMIITMTTLETIQLYVDSVDVEIGASPEIIELQ